jgi:hypothetical protein
MLPLGDSISPTLMLCCDPTRLPTPRHFPTDVTGQHELGNLDARRIADGGRDLLHMYVFPPTPTPRTTLTIPYLFGQLCPFVQILWLFEDTTEAEPYPIDGAAEFSLAKMQPGEGINGSKKSPDPTVRKNLALIRKTVLPDSAFHDKVRSVVHIAIPYVRYWLGGRSLMSSSIVFRL